MEDMNKKVNPKRRRVILSVSLLLGSILFLLLCTELLLRTVGYSYGLYLGKVEFGWPDPITIEEKFVFDKDLFWIERDHYVQLQKAYEERPTIIFLGDSCTQWGSYPRYLIDIMSVKYPNKEISHSKFGTGGWSSYQGLQLLKRDIVNIQPKIITILYGWNDYWLGFGIEDKDAALLTPSFLSRFQDSRFIQLIIKTQVVILQRKKKIEKRTVRVSPEDFRDNLQKIVNLARDNGITPILLTSPTLYRKGEKGRYYDKRALENPADVIPLHQKYVSIVRDVASKEKAILCDLAKEFDTLSKEGTIKKYFRENGIHLTREGNLKIVEFLYDCFKKNNILEEI